MGDSGIRAHSRFYLFLNAVNKEKEIRPDLASLRIMLAKKLRWLEDD